MTAFTTFRLLIACDNAAFNSNTASELARILRDVATRIERGDDISRLRNVHDSHENIVGQFRLASINQLGDS